MHAVQAKGHGLATGTLTGCLPSWRKAISQLGSYDAVLALATNAGNTRDNFDLLARGLALNVIGPLGEGLSDIEEDTQDQVLVNGLVLAALKSEALLGDLNMLATRPSKAEGAGKVLSGVFRTIKAGLEAIYLIKIILI